MGRKSRPNPKFLILLIDRVKLAWKIATFVDSNSAGNHAENPDRISMIWS